MRANVQGGSEGGFPGSSGQSLLLFRAQEEIRQAEPNQAAGPEENWTPCDFSDVRGSECLC